MPTVIAVDAMGGDHGPSVTVPACLDFIASDPDVKLALVGRPEALSPELARHGATSAVDIVPASEVVEMHEDVRTAIRTKKNSSMRVAIDLVKEGRAAACVSAGNTGALMGTAKFVLKTLPGIERPAFCAVLPTRTGGGVYALDLGANAECTPEQLLQFAIMGATLVTAMEGKARPSVGLLNIGSEELKGNDTVKRAGELLRASALNFRGNVEGDDIYKGTTDVVVCDGFAGNIALKASEGVAKMLGDFLREEYTRNIFSKFAAFVSYPVIERFRRRVDHRHYNGATLLGLKGIVIKSHGSADRLAFRHALQRAATEARSGLLDRIGAEIARLHSAGVLTAAAQ